MVVNSLYYNSPQPFKAEQTTISISDEVLTAALQSIYAQNPNPTTPTIEPHLFAAISKTLLSALKEPQFPAVSLPGIDPILPALRHSIDVFSAFKVHRAQSDMAARLLDSNGNLKPFEQWKAEVLPIASHQCGTWLETEYNTAVLRARQTAQWQQFLAEKDVLPNLKWLPSTSPNPGADHRLYWNTILPIDHPFWDQHRPGDRWNCKCSLSSTDESPTPVPSEEEPPFPTVSPSGNNPHPGLAGNPAKTRALFSQDHPYFPKDCNHCTFYKPNVKSRLRSLSLFKAQTKDCYNCPYINNCLDNIYISKSDNNEKERIMANRKEYEQLLHNTEYKDVVFDEKNGGLKATHIGHIIHKGEKEQLFFDGLTSTDLEKECQEQLFKMGHKAILSDESKTKDGSRLAALDLIMDDICVEIRSITGTGWYSHSLRTKNEQIMRYNRREDIEKGADSLCLYFHDPNLFDINKMELSIDFFKKLKDKEGNLVIRYLKHVYCVIKGGTGLLHFDI